MFTVIIRIEGLCMEDNQHLENICIKQVVVLQKKETINKNRKRENKAFQKFGTANWYY